MKTDKIAKEFMVALILVPLLGDNASNRFSPTSKKLLYDISKDATR
jgi:hypothetical protein